MKQIIAFFSLFTSVGTLFCCALPALFVTLGFGATFAGLTNAVPQIIWLGAHKHIVFFLGGIFLALGFGMSIFFPPRMVCDIDGNPCETTRSWNRPLLYLSIFLYSIGGFFAYLAPFLL